MAEELSVPGADALEKAFELGALKQQPIALNDGSQALLVPDGFGVKQFWPVDREQSKIVKANATLIDIDSFNSYVNKYKTPSTRIFAAPGYAPGASGQAYFKAVLDYHGDSQTVGTNRHTATYQPPYSEEWKLWVRTKHESMQQVDFAEFIEENRKDIRDPSAAFLLELVRRFKFKKTQNFESVVYQHDGSQAITWEDKVKNEEGTIPVPEELTVGLPVYFEGAAYPLTVFMRYRTAESKAYFTLKPDRADYVERAAFIEVAAKVSTETGVEVMLGNATASTS